MADRFANMASVHGLLRHYGAPMLSSSSVDWESVRATVIRRERTDATQQRFRLPWHAFRFGLAGTFGRGSTTRLDDQPSSPIARGTDAIAFYPAGTTILNEITSAPRLSYLTVEIDPSLTGAQHDDGAVLRVLRPEADVRCGLSVALLRALESAARGGSDASSRLFTEQAALMLLLAASRRQSPSAAASTARHRGGLGAACLARVSDYMNEHLAEDLSLRDLSALAGLSTTHFCRAFKQSTGTTPHRWHLRARLARAMQLLADPHLPLAQLALAVGFAGQSQFTTAFAREVGMPPGAWRRARL